jgi:hypothetical protein
MRKLRIVIYVGIAALITAHCYRYPMYDVDLLSYAGNVALFGTSDPVQVHRVVYQYPLTSHLRGLDKDDELAQILRRRAADAYYSAAYLPYFSVKPLYVLAMEAAHKLGASVIDASRIVSALFFFGIAIVVWLYTSSLFAVVILVLPEAMILGQSLEPDGMSVFLLLVGLWVLFIKKKEIGILPIVCSVWVRPDNVIACVVILAFLYASRRISRSQTIILLLLALASEALISHYGYGLRALYDHTFLGGDPTGVPHFTGVDYTRALLRGVNELIHSSVPIFSLLWLLAYGSLKNGIRQILGIAAIYSALRFVVYPSYEPRYYSVFFLITAIAALLSIREVFARRSYLNGVPVRAPFHA